MKKDAKRGDWVMIRKTILTPDERTANLPEDTRKVPLEIRAKGFLENDQAFFGDQVRIKTIIGRILEGRLEAFNPEYGHSFGRAVPELLPLGRELKKLLDIERK